jgi:superfamily II DNA/RNA helicase
MDKLNELLEDESFTRVLVFGETKMGVENIYQELADRGHRVETIHGDKTQFKRQRALEKFSMGHARVLVATDVAARGLDISNVSHVINYDEPQNFQDYIHRIGRTGRGAKGGKAITFVIGRR